MIIDGRQLSREILARTKVRAEELPHPPHVLALVASETPATRSYLKIKGLRAADAGCSFEARPLGAPFEGADAVIVQLPLPTDVDQKAACDAIPLSKDADVLSFIAREKFERAEADALLPPVVGAIKEIFRQNGVEVKGKKAVVIGNGWLVGAPCATWLKQQGAEVETLDSATKLEDFSMALRTADIIVAGAGVPHLIKPEYLKRGVVLIDAATSESNGILAGDADPVCAEVCSLFTPVPGGVGPIAVACLFENAVTLAHRQAERAMNS